MLQQVLQDRRPKKSRKQRPRGAKRVPWQTQESRATTPQRARDGFMAFKSPKKLRAPFPGFGQGGVGGGGVEALCGRRGTQGEDIRRGEDNRQGSHTPNDPKGVGGLISVDFYSGV